MRSLCFFNDSHWTQIYVQKQFCVNILKTYLGNSFKSKIAKKYLHKIIFAHEFVSNENHEKTLAKISRNCVLKLTKKLQKIVLTHWC